MAIAWTLATDGRVRMTQIPNATMDGVTDFALDNVQIGSEVRTGGWKGYDAVGRHRYEHLLTSLKASDGHAHVVLPAVHRIASLLKRRLLVTPQGAVSPSTSATASKSSRSASTEAAPATAGCSSTASSRARSAPHRSPTRR